MTNNMEINVTDQSIDRAISEAHVLLIDFWAPWCGPCRALGPVISEVADEYAGRVVVAKYNADEYEEAAARFGIRGIPALLYFKDGQLVNRSAGAVSKAQIKETLDSLL